MKRIQLTPTELKSQASEMTSLMEEYESLFGSVTNILNDTNNHWSANLSHNFAGKITSAQKGFSTVIDMLQYGATAASSSAESFEGIDAQLGKILHGIENRISNVGKSSQLQLGTQTISKKTSDNTIGITGDYKKDIEKFYHKKMDENTPDEDGYSYEKVGTDFGRTTLFGNVYYEKKRDIHRYYGNYQSGSNYERANGSASIIAEEIVIAEHGCDTEFDIKVNHIKYYGDSEYNPRNGTAYFSAGVNYDVVSVGIKAGDIKKDLIEAEVNLKAGLGLGMEAGIDDGIIKVNVSAALGPGFDINLELNYKEAWNEVCDMLSIGE